MIMTYAYDAIVVGLGAMGSATTYQLSKRGVRVLGLDMYEPGHDQGSSHGHHRMFRKWTHREGFLPLAARAYELWRELEEESSRNILNMIGEVGLIDLDLAIRFHGFEDEDFDPTRGGKVEILDEQSLAERFPGFRLYEGVQASYEADAGFLRPEVGIAAHLDLAERHGAALHYNEEVTAWSPDGQGVRVETARGTYTANRLIITTGPWAAELLGALDLRLEVVRIVNGYFEPTKPEWWRAENGAPNFILWVPEGAYYGMPSIDGVGLKIGRHDNGVPTTARTIRREIDEAEIEMLRNTLDRYMPGASGPSPLQVTCMYTMTPDENHIVERHPEYRQVLYGCGFSGTGFKFSGVFGEALADLATEGETGHDIEFLRSSRFAGAVAGD